MVHERPKNSPEITFAKGFSCQKNYQTMIDEEAKFLSKMGYKKLWVYNTEIYIFRQAHK